jgi:hypothetical protein
VIEIKWCHRAGVPSSSWLESLCGSAAVTLRLGPGSR